MVSVYLPDVRGPYTCACFFLLAGFFLFVFASEIEQLKAGLGCDRPPRLANPKISTACSVSGKRFLPKEGGGVYSSRWCYGSPAHKYSLGCTTWIVEVRRRFASLLLLPSDCR